MGLIDGAAAGAVVVLWGLTVVAAKVGVAQIPPFLLMAIRFGLAALLLAGFLRRWRALPLVRLALLSLTLCGGHFGLMFVGLMAVDAGVTAILLQLGIPFSAVLAAVVFKERLTLGQMGGMVLAFAGTAVLIGTPKTASQPVYVGLIVASAFMWAVTNIQVKKLGQVRPMAMNAWVSVFAVPLFLLLSLIFETGQTEAVAAADARAWSALAFIVLGASLGAWGLWYWLLGRHPINKIAPLTFLAPLVTVLAATVLLDEPLSLRLIIGGLLTVAGVAVVERLRPATPPRAVDASHD